MKEFRYNLKDAQGIHARPAGALVKLAATFPCDIKIAKDGKEVDAKRIMGVMSLGAKQGDEIIIKATGEYEDAAIEQLEQFIKDNL